MSTTIPKSNAKTLTYKQAFTRPISTQQLTQKQQQLDKEVNRINRQKEQAEQVATQRKIELEKIIAERDAQNTIANELKQCQLAAAKLQQNAYRDKITQRALSTEGEFTLVRPSTKSVQQGLMWRFITHIRPVEWIITILITSAFGTIDPLLFLVALISCVCLVFSTTFVEQVTRRYKYINSVDNPEVMQRPRMLSMVDAADPEPHMMEVEIEETTIIWAKNYFFHKYLLPGTIFIREVSRDQTINYHIVSLVIMSELMCPKIMTPSDEEKVVVMKMRHAIASMQSVNYDRFHDVLGDPIAYTTMRLALDKYRSLRDKFSDF
jgi:DNA polymerase elongation subunit (family B)